MSEWIYTNGLYEPKTNMIGECIESPDGYFLRIKNILPNFPREVLIQWFYEHWNDIDNFAWLGFEKLNFDCVEWSVSELLASGIKDNEVIETYKHNFLNGSCSDRMKSLSSYFKRYGTWPIAPLLLKNLDNNISYPNGLACNSPYHPIEGYHRFAILFANITNASQQKRHQIWLAGG